MASASQPRSEFSPRCRIEGTLLWLKNAYRRFLIKNWLEHKKSNNTMQEGVFSKSIQNCGWFLTRCLQSTQLLFNRKEPFPVVCTLFVLKRQDRACPLPKAMRTCTLTILKWCSVIITECWCKIAGAICCLVSHSKARNNTQKYLSHPFPFVSVFPSLLWLHERSGLPLESGLSDWTVQAVRGPNQWPLVTVG